MNKIHFLYVPFTGLGLYKGYRGDQWLKNRITVFKNFVVPALMNQTKQEFIVWMSWRPEERANSIVQDLMKSLDQLRGMRFVHTFGGCCFYDDKYPPEIATQRVLKSLYASLPDLKSWVPEDTDYVLMTIAASDDMYISHAVKEIQEFEYKEKRAIGYAQGYIMNYRTLEMAYYNPKTIPPFFTIMFPPQVFLNPGEHYKYIGPYESHEYIKDVMEFIPLKGRGFIVGTHGENISTSFEHSFRGALLEEDEREAILIQSGLFTAQPVVLEKDYRRKFMKKLMNALPRALQYQIVRSLSPGVTTKIKEYKWFNF